MKELKKQLGWDSPVPNWEKGTIGDCPQLSHEKESERDDV